MNGFIVNIFYIVILANCLFNTEGSVYPNVVPLKVIGAPDVYLALFLDNWNHVIRDRDRDRDRDGGL
jgi:hypothetical protein